MVLDTSVIVAICMSEPQSMIYADKLFDSSVNIVGTPTLLEAHMVLRGKVGDDADRLLAAMLRRYDITPVAFTNEHLDAAKLAFDRYGKGHHPARLNYGDCLAYGLSEAARQPLLFHGDDFALTDVRRA